MLLQSGDGGSASRRHHQHHHGEPAPPPPLPPPAGLVLLYPALDMNIGNWMTDEQMSLVRDRRSRTTNRAVLRRMNSAFGQLAPKSPHHSDVEDDDDDGSDDRGAKPTRAASPEKLSLIHI